MFKKQSWISRGMVGLDAFRDLWAVFVEVALGDSENARVVLSSVGWFWVVWTVWVPCACAKAILSHTPNWTTKLSCSVTLEKKNTLFREDHF